ncbi:hypothetical protein [Changping earthworm virus 2]|uniref:hypothetical protein n=1 Tax=Changping earthworm virus 2 TaxID=1922827 RepID=UPI00090B180D|nr:hypothetical protein [Changping earthworm virus 2]APG77871.1 hypothetical protein [Changping earthworm virus 2]
MNHRMNSRKQKHGDMMNYNMTNIYNTNAMMRIRKRKINDAEDMRAKRKCLEDLRKLRTETHETGFRIETLRAAELLMEDAGFSDSTVTRANSKLLRNLGHKIKPPNIQLHNISMNRFSSIMVKTSEYELNSLGIEPIHAAGRTYIKFQDLSKLCCSRTTDFDSALAEFFNLMSQRTQRSYNLWKSLVDEAQILEVPRVPTHQLQEVVMRDKVLPTTSSPLEVLSYCFPAVYPNVVRLSPLAMVENDAKFVENVIRMVKSLHFKMLNQIDGEVLGHHLMKLMTEDKGLRNCSRATPEGFEMFSCFFNNTYESHSISINMAPPPRTDKRIFDCILNFAYKFVDGSVTKTSLIKAFTKFADTHRFTIKDHDWSSYGYECLFCTALMNGDFPKVHTKHDYVTSILKAGGILIEILDNRCAYRKKYPRPKKRFHSNRLMPGAPVPLYPLMPVVHTEDKTEWVTFLTGEKMIFHNKTSQCYFEIIGLNKSPSFEITCSPQVSPDCLTRCYKFVQHWLGYPPGNSGNKYLWSRQFDPRCCWPFDSDDPYTSKPKMLFVAVHNIERSQIEIQIQPSGKVLKCLSRITVDTKVKPRARSLRMQVLDFNKSGVIGQLVGSGQKMQILPMPPPKPWPSGFAFEGAAGLDPNVTFHTKQQVFKQLVSFLLNHSMPPDVLLSTVLPEWKSTFGRLLGGLETLAVRSHRHGHSYNIEYMSKTKNISNFLRTLALSVPREDNVTIVKVNPCDMVLSITDDILKYTTSCPPMEVVEFVSVTKEPWALSSISLGPGQCNEGMFLILARTRHRSVSQLEGMGYKVEKQLTADEYENLPFYRTLEILGKFTSLGFLPLEGMGTSILGIVVKEDVACEYWVVSLKDVSTKPFQIKARKGKRINIGTTTGADLINEAIEKIKQRNLEANKSTAEDLYKMVNDLDDWDTDSIAGELKDNDMAWLNDRVSMSDRASPTRTLSRPGTPTSVETATASALSSWDFKRVNRRLSF